MTAVLDARGLGKKYRSRWALRDCTLQVPPGRVVGLVGPNGAGKTTLLHLAVGLLQPTAGQIDILGDRPASSPEHLGRVGFVAQDTPAYSGLSVADHLRMGGWLNPRWDDGMAQRRIDQLHLDRKQRAGKLSGGQRAQLALTLALAKRPELLVLDEPVASLDPLARREFLQHLMEAVAEGGISVVLSSHLVADLERVCDYVIVLTASRVQLAGDVEDLLASHYRLTGPRRDVSRLPAGQEVIEASHTDRQTTLLIRTDAPIHDPAWTIEPVGLEDLVLAYMGRTNQVEHTSTSTLRGLDRPRRCRMIRLSWRQFRAQAIVAGGLLLAIAVVLIATRSHLSYLYGIYAKAEAACKASRDCRDVSINLSQLDKLLELLGTALVALPALVGAFWGAPLIAREFEAGTHRLAWTQSVSRTRWLAAKLGVVGLGSVLVTALLSLMVTWWSSPIDRAHPSRFGSGMFGERNIAPIGYAAFGFALGVAAGLLIRRTLPAMAATLFGVLAVRIAFTYAVRPKLFTPVRKAVALNPDTTGFGSNNGGPQTLFPNPPDLPNAWLYSTRVVDGSGKGLDPQVVATTCPTLGHAGPPPIAGNGTTRTQAPADVQSALHDCVQKIAASYHVVTTYQPANRYWPLQWFETGVYVAAALAVAGFCFWWIRRRAR